MSDKTPYCNESYYKLKVTEVLATGTKVLMFSTAVDFE